MNIEPFTFVLERLDQLLAGEIKLSTDKKELLYRLRIQLEPAQSFVRDVEEEKELTTISDALETEFQHIMRLLPRIEDYLYTIHPEEEVQTSHSKPSFFHKFKVCFSCTSCLPDTGARLIKDLEDTCRRVSCQRHSVIPQTTRRRRPLPQPHIMNDEFIVGLEEVVESLVSKLTGENGERTAILGIVGMGGSGKTTLARRLYNHPQIKRKFTVRAWICASREWDTTRPLRGVCEQVGLQLPQDSYTVPTSELQNLLLSSSCVVVIDDVWRREALQDFLPYLLPECGGKENSKILVTTRNEEILDYPTLGGVHIHRARCLTEEESWELFSKIVRSKWQGIRSFDDETEFAKLGKEMLGRCHGLPFAIVALAGLLSTKGTVQDWEVLKENVISARMRQNKGFLDSGSVWYMLELSYLDLPYDLKPCFLYLGIFPEDSRIDVKDLIQLWIGEGLLRPNMCYEGQTLEELGMDVVNELVQRCIVQVVSRDYEEKAEKIHLHDLMRDLCMQKARESLFFCVASPIVAPSNTVDLRSRRALILKDGGSYSICSPRSRSVVSLPSCFGKWVKLELAYEKLKMLRVLHLVQVELRESETQIGSLVALRYLKIEDCTGVTSMLLDSLRSLTNLLTFMYNGRGEAGIPNNIVSNMEHLRRLCLTTSKFEGSGLGVGRSSNMQCLRLWAGEWLTKELAMTAVSGLRELRLREIYSQEQLETISDFVSNPSNCLQILDLSLKEKSGLEFDLQRMNVEGCQRLATLELTGRIRMQHSLLFFAHNLSDLSLFHTRIGDEGNLQKALAQLHKLRRLLLGWRSYDGEKLTMTLLPHLQELTLEGLANLKEWTMEGGVPWQLKHIEIQGCEQLGRIPEGLCGIGTLQFFIVDYMPVSFCERLQRPSEGEGGGISEGLDFHLIRHIPNINVRDLNGSRYM